MSERGWDFSSSHAEDQLVIKEEGSRKARVLGGCGLKVAFRWQQFWVMTRFRV